MNHETGETRWAGIFRGWPIEAELALIRDPVIYNGEKTAPDEIYLPELRRSDLIMKVPSSRIIFTLKNNYFYLHADKTHPAEEWLRWGPSTVGRSRVMVGIPKDSPPGTIFFCAARISEENGLGFDNVDGFLDGWASGYTLAELEKAAATPIEGEDGKEPDYISPAALKARLEAMAVYFHDAAARVVIPTPAPCFTDPAGR